MKVQTHVTIEREDVAKRFGAVRVEEIAATLYNAFHGHEECCVHPFFWDDNGDFHGTLPWDQMKPNGGDDVVQAFRLAALAAYDALKSTGVGHLS